jgi:two-component system NtrC family sensor kinase
MRRRLAEYVCPPGADEATRRRVAIAVDACLVGAGVQLLIAAVRAGAGDRSFRLVVLMVSALILAAVPLLVRATRSLTAAGVAGTVAIGGTACAMMLTNGGLYAPIVPASAVLPAVMWLAFGRVPGMVAGAVFAASAWAMAGLTVAGAMPRPFDLASTLAYAMAATAGIAVSLLVMRRFEAETERSRLRAESAERLAALGTLAAGVAHEINNPLTVVRACAESVAATADPPTRRHAEDALDAVARIERVVADLGAVTPRVATPREVRVLDAARTALRVAGRRVSAHVDVSLAGEEEATVRADEASLVQVLANLLVNAAQATSATRRGAVTVAARVEAGDGPPQVVLDVDDDGPGVPVGLRARVFEPFFTTKEAAGGAGLGLHIARRLVMEAGGTIEALDAPGSGARFRLTFPAVLRPVAQEERPTPPERPRAAHARARGRESGRPSSAAGLRVLVVDDDALVARSIARSLGPDVETHIAGDAAAALAYLAQGAKVDAIVLDVTMPGESGVALHARLAEAHPALAARCVFVTGGFLDDKARVAAAATGLPVLAKPVPAAELRAAVGAAARARDASGPRPRPAPDAAHAPSSNGGGGR